MRATAALFLLASCAHRTQETTHVDAVTEVQARTAASEERHVVETVTSAPGRVTVTTEEFSAGPARADVAPAVPATGQLLRRTVRVEEHGAVTLARHDESTVSATSEEHVDSRMAVTATKTASTSAGPSPWLVALGIAVAIVVVALAVYARLGGRW